MSTDPATDLSASPLSVGPRTPKTPPRSAAARLEYTQSVTDTSMTYNVGDSSYGHPTVKDDLRPLLKAELRKHHVEGVEPPKLNQAHVQDARAFLDQSPLYDHTLRRWHEIPASPKREQELYAPQAAIFSAILDHFEFKERRLMVPWNKKIEHAPHADEKLKTSPDYCIVGLGPLVNGKSRFPTPSTILPPDCGWADYDFITNPGDAKKHDNVNLFDDGIQLSVYARQCFIQQHNRDFVLTYLMTERNFRVIRFDRCGMMSTTDVNYHEDPVAFVNLFRIICSDDAESIGYNPTLYFEKIDDQRTRFFESTFIRVVDDEEARSQPALKFVQNQVQVDDDDGLGVIDDSRLFVEEKLKLRVHNKPMHFRRGLRGRGGVYWASEDSKLGKVIVKQSYRPSGRVPEWKFLRKAVGVPGVGQMVAYDTRVWKVSDSRWPGGTGKERFYDREWSCAVIQQYGSSIDNFRSHTQLLVAFRDAIAGHRALWDMYILHRDVSIPNILLGVVTAPDGWKGVIIDLDMAIFMLRKSSNVGVDFRTGTRAFQSVQVLASYQYEIPDAQAETVPADSQRLMHDYLDDLESFYWCLCWICFSYESPGQLEKNAKVEAWQHDDPKHAANAKSDHLLGPFDPSLVKPSLQPLVPLLRSLHGLFQRMLTAKRVLVAAKMAHARTLAIMRKEADSHYDYVLNAIQQAIDSIGAEDAREKETQTRSYEDYAALFAVPELPTAPARALVSSRSFGGKRKSQEEPDEQKACIGRTVGPFNLRHPESIDS
ncbi:hypothetical protein BD626DRAFT_580464 [Schizophyllum amplum]|uniref:Fungal-type protein kinase domain-containing protein n=1 Tax=Schizophyllum amplum TaxID=97359 RepID=A0A550D023_9AGAR|nr:hypothetical protein BD626DRAFT_580464 [Auriculariopsis ampla]